MRAEPSSPTPLAHPVPVLRTDSLQASLCWYEGVLGLRVTQRVPGTFALLQGPGFRLQLWQVPLVQSQACCVQVDSRFATIFECHARLARSARTWIGATPALQPWGAWEFSLQDPLGHRLRFVQWPTTILRCDPSGALPERKAW